jgi:protein-disulfide isomerase
MKLGLLSRAVVLLGFLLRFLPGFLPVFLGVSACAVTKPPSSSAPLSPAGTPEAEAATEPSAAAPPATVPPEQRPEHALAKVPVSTADPQWGSVDAPVTIVEISDFQCPFCARVAPTLAALKQKYGPSQLRIVWKNNPLPFHKAARPTADTGAAIFMLAGNTAFWRFHDRVFANQQELTPENLEAWAREAGVSSQALFGWIEAGKPAAKVQEDMDLARAIGATGTPAFRINGVTLSGAQPLEKFVEVVDQQLAAAKQLTQSGVPPRLVYSVLTDKNFQAPDAAPSGGGKDDDDDSKVWNVPVAADDPVRGSRDALVTIVQFSDFQCPFCKRVEDTLDEVRKLYGKDVRIVWKDNPLPFHPRAKPAAAMAQAVFKRQGNDAFWRVHDAIFASQPKLEDSDLEAIAKELKIPWAPLKAVIAAEKAPAKIEDSIAMASDFQARGTPHFFINGRRLSGAQPLDAFKKLIDEQLAKAKALVDAGTPRSMVFTKLMKEGDNPAPPETKQVALRADAPARGSAKAPVVIQMFSDFQCPFCKRVEPTLAQLEKDFKGSIRIVWRHLPLPFHDKAQLAAEAAEEVLAQKGPAAFWAYHDALFEAQGEPEGLARDNLVRLALVQGVDVNRFEAALDSHVHAAKVNADAEVANKAGINGTPAFVINDYYLSGAQPVAAFSKLIRLAQKPPKKP